MSQRNPMNERYQEERLGKTRKSAATLKPKTKAASSVHLTPQEKTKQQRKAERKAERREERRKQAELDRKYYNPPTAQYKRLRRLWWGLLAGAVVFTAISILGRALLPDTLALVILAAAYICIIGALYVDFIKIRKVRREYQEEMESRKSKEQRALEKQQRAAERAAKAEAAEKFEEAKAAEAAKPKKGLFGLLGGKKKDDGAAGAADAAAAGSSGAAAKKDSQTSTK